MFKIKFNENRYIKNAMIICAREETERERERERGGKGGRGEYVDFTHFQK